MKFIFSLLVAVIVGSLSCFAADLDSVDYYSFSPVQSLSPTVNSALDYAVQPMDLSTDESNWLKGIWQGVTQTSTLNGGSLLYNIQQLRTSFSSFAGMDFWDYVMDDIEDIRVELSEDYSYTFRSLISDIRDAFYSVPSVSTGSLISMIREMNVALGLIKVDADTTANGVNSISIDMDSVISHITSIDTGVSAIGPVVDDIKDDLVDYSNYIMQNRSVDYQLINSDGSFSSRGQFNTSVGWGVAHTAFQLIYDAARLDGQPTIKHYLARLANTLASYDDVQLAASQKANREEIEDSFLSGSSGGMSLGVSDFGNLADVGGTIKDSLSLDGNATIGSFTSGLAAADSAGQGWFSEETRSQLDAVSSTVTYSLRDPDPYNMEGWEDRYYWLLGDDE